MKYRREETGESDKPRRRQEQAPRRGPQPVDVWRFKEIRETLWGTGTSAKGSKGIWDFSGIRKRLWGR